MRLDTTPLTRAGIGFDQLARVFDTVGRNAQSPNFPPYDIEKLGEDRYTITMAVAGFSADELNISAEDRLLVITGSKQDAPQGTYLHRGIAGRSFERRFVLADHIVVGEARLENGLLSVDLALVLPEAKKPRQIAITAQAA